MVVMWFLCDLQKMGLVLIKNVDKRLYITCGAGFSISQLIW